MNAAVSCRRGGRLARRLLAVLAGGLPGIHAQDYVSDPIPARIVPSGLVVAVRDIANLGNYGTYRLSQLTFAPGFPDRRFVVDMAGLVWMLREGAAPAVYLNLASQRGTFTSGPGGQIGLT